MRRGKIFLIALGSVLGLGPGCSASRPREARVSGALEVVRFPGPWLKAVGGSDLFVNDNVHYVLRKSPRGELLFAVKQGFTGELYGSETSDFPVEDPDYDYYSDTRYALALEGGRVRPATAEEWDAAEKVLHSYHFIQTFRNPQVGGEGVSHNGRLFRRTGESWGNQAALVSPRGTWIAVFSYTSREKPPPALIPGFGGGGAPGHGEVFIDVYRVSSGEKVAGARSPYGGDGAGFDPSMLFGASLWVEDRYLIMPLVWWLDACWVGVLPEG